MDSDGLVVDTCNPNTVMRNRQQQESSETEEPAVSLDKVGKGNRCPLPHPVGRHQTISVSREEGVSVHNEERLNWRCEHD